MIKQKMLFRHFLIAVIFSAPFLVQAIELLMGVTFEIAPWLQIVLATVVQFVGGLPLYIESLESIKAKRWSGNYLILLGTLTAYFFSIYHEWGHQPLYFVVSTVTITLTMFGRWLDALEEPENPSLQTRLEGRVTKILLPIILLMIAFSTLYVGFSNAIQVLIAMTPATLVLAVPLVSLISKGVASPYGIHYKSVGALENFSGLKTLFFEPRGVFTQGAPFVQHIHPLAPHTSQDVLSISASLEEWSKHPFAKAIIRKAREEGVAWAPVEYFEVFEGEGVSGRIGEEAYHLGSLSFAKEFGIMPNPELIWMEREGESVIALWSPTQVIGYIGLADHLRETSIETVEHIKKRGIQPIFLTGDQHETARAIAQHLDIPDVISDMLPADRWEEVEKAKAKGKVGVVGNLFLSSPEFLHHGDASMALGPHLDESADLVDVVINRNDLLGVVDTIDFAQKVNAKVKINVFFALIFHLLAALLAVMGLFNPFVAVGTIAMSLLSVIANTLLLRYWKSVRE